MKHIHFVFAMVLVAVCTALGVYHAARNTHSVQAVAISILSQIPRSCLVLETAEELSVANIDSGGWLLGPRCAMASAVCRSHWGIELSGIQPKDIKVSGREVIIQVPNPTVFDSAVDWSSFRFLVRRSGFQALADAVYGRSLMRELADIACRTPAKFSPEQIQARRSEFIRRLNEQAAGLFQAKDLNVRFE